MEKLIVLVGAVQLLNDKNEELIKKHPLLCLALLNSV